ncbi:MAG: YeeE/YedE family protein [Sphingobacteriaceae bacterium]|nr:YeeE/YedE family protein [Sphingobacteriaceae bacterium]
MKMIKFLLLGAFFGVILVKAEVISWFRIHEMFLFQSFHMYGIIGSAILTGIISIQLIKKLKIKTIEGEEIIIGTKELNKGTVIGGLLFGLGWALTGACPGPLYACFGSGYWVFIVAILSAVLGTYTYGKLKNKLPH